MSKYVENIVKQAKRASYQLARLSTAQKNKTLRAMADYLLKRKNYILAQNAKDVKAAAKRNLAKSFIDRLTLSDKRLEEMSGSLNEVAGLSDPVGKEIARCKRPNGMILKKVRTPIGVVMVVYEARPNVTSDCAGLLFKASNVGILRGGSDSAYSNSAIAKVLALAVKASGIKFSPFFIVENTAHSVVDELLKQNEYIDLVIPRGGETLIRKVVQGSRIPVIKHYKGVCKIFVDKTADLKMALNICYNAKVQRSSVCNAAESILVHKDIAKKFLPMLKEKFDSAGVVIRADGPARKIISGVKAADQADWSREYLDLIAAIKVVADVDEAISHINAFGSHHTDSIVTASKASADKFVKEVDSACCFVNVSTRLSDGHQFGLGAEIGISTDKLHARGPMGLEELTTYKWVALGSGQVRE